MAGSTDVLPTMLTIGGANLHDLVEDEELLQGMHFSGLVGEKVRIPGSPIMRCASSMTSKPRLKNNPNDGLFCAYAYPAPYTEGTRSTRIR